MTEGNRTFNTRSIAERIIRRLHVTFPFPNLQAKLLNCEKFEAKKGGWVGD